MIPRQRHGSDGSHVLAAINEETAAFCRYLPVTIGNIASAALIDSGNTWRNVISDTFARRLGIRLHDLIPLRGSVAVKTAQKGASLQVLGEVPSVLRLALPQPRYLNMPAADRNYAVFDFQPVVVKNLAMPINISGTFLKMHNIDQIHSKDCLRLPQGQLVPLSQYQQPPTVDSIDTPVLVAKNVTIPPLCIAHIDVSVPKTPNNPSAPADGFLEGNPALYNKNLAPWISAIVSVTNGKTRAGVVNTSERPVKLAAGTRYGTFTRLCLPADQYSYPWCIAAVAPDRPSHKPTVREKLQKILQDMKQSKDEPEEPQDPEPITKSQKLAWLEKHFRISKAPHLKDNPEQQMRLKLLLIKYWDTISVRGEYGRTNLIEHEIRTKCAPIKCKARPINPMLEPDLKKQLDANLEKDVIEPSNSPWSFPLVAAPKKNNKIRWCIDYRKLNFYTQKDVYPLPSIEDNLCRLSNAKIFTTLDGSGAFHVIPIKRSDRPKTAFSTPYGLFQYKRMPFGLCNGPASYSRLIQLALSGIPTTWALPYLDDIIVISRTVQEHFRNLEAILLVHRRAGLKLQPSKCFLFQLEVEYLGHLVSADGIKTVPAYVQVVKDWPLPLTRSEIRIFLGKCGYYRRFIKNYSAIAAPLTDLSGKGTPAEEKAPVPRSEAFVDAFLTLKQHLLKAPILAYPKFDSDEPFILDTDWSATNNAIGGVLSQKQDGKERVIAYGGKKMSKAQKNYDPFKGELSALLHFSKIWRYYLQYRPFILRVDHAPLTHMKTMQPQDRHTLRMLSVLADLDFTIQHRKGTSHGNADALSRAPHVGLQDDSEDVGTDDAIDVNIYSVSQEGSAFAYTKQAMQVLQDSDESIAVVKEAVAQKEKPSTLAQAALPPEARHYFLFFDNLQIGPDGLLRYNRPTPSDIKRPPVICLPSETWDKLIQQAHFDGGHCGINATVERLSRAFYFPRMKAEVTDWIKTCHHCLKKQKHPQQQRHTLISVREGYPFQKISIDFVGPLHPIRGKQFIVTARCCFTRWLECRAVSTATTKNAIAFLTDDIIKRFGIPEEIHSDQGSHFTSRAMQEVADALNIRFTFTPSFNPKSNLVERAHRDLGNILRAMQSQTGKDWVSCLPAAVMAMNTNVHSATKFSPYQLLFGRDPPMPLDLAFPPPQQYPVNDTNAQQIANDLKARIQAAYRSVRENLHVALERRRQGYKQARKGYHAGDVVWLFTPTATIDVARKLQNYWSGPWTVTKPITPVLYEIQAPEHWQILKKLQVVSIDRLAPFAPNSREEQVDPQADIALDGDEFAERPDLPDGFHELSRPDQPPNPPPGSPPPADESDLEGEGDIEDFLFDNKSQVGEQEQEQEQEQQQQPVQIQQQTEDSSSKNDQSSILRTPAQSNRNSEIPNVRSSREIQRSSQRPRERSLRRNLFGERGVEQEQAATERTEQEPAATSGGARPRSARVRRPPVRDDSFVWDFTKRRK